MSWWGSMVDSLTGGDAKRAAKRQGAKADEQTALAQQQMERLVAVQEERRAAEQAQIDQMEQRYNEFYAPVERAIAEDLQNGPDHEGEASIAANRFGGDFDRSAEAARRQAMRYGIQPGSEQTRRTEDANAYNRARGIAGAANTARRAEDDAHWLKSNAFFQQGSGLKRDVLAGIQSMYGAEASTTGALINGYQGFAGHYQGNADRFAQESAAAKGALFNAGTQIALGVAGGPAGAAIGGALGQAGSAIGGAIANPRRAYGQAREAIGTTFQNSAWDEYDRHMQYDATPVQAIPTASRENGPNTGVFMDGSGYGGVSGNGQNGNTPGEIRGAINYQGVR